MSEPVPPTMDAARARALAAYDDLTGLAEEIEDEWSYVNDLAEAWRLRLSAMPDDGASTPFDAAAAAAIDAAVDEIARITDPHRAIDWLSTFPQVVLLAMGERP